MNKISMIGCGRLGLCLALNIEKTGRTVTGIDVNDEYIKSLNEKTFKSPEPGVSSLLKRSKINFSTDVSDALDSDVIFICVNTPSTEFGDYDQSQIEEVMKKLNDVCSVSKKVVINCTTTPGYCADLQERYKNFSISYNPEFIAQGSIIENQLRPDMVLIGEADKESGDVIEDIYFDVCTNFPAICRMNVTEAEITKLATNCFITSKIAMTNAIGDIATSFKVNPQVVLDAIGKDSRIGDKCTTYGFGFGGPCFPRDNRAFAYVARRKGADDTMSKAIDESNKNHLLFQLKEHTRNYTKNNQIVFNDVSYKPGTDIIEESQQLRLAVELARSGFDVALDVDESVKKQVEEKYPNLFRWVSHGKI